MLLLWGLLLFAAAWTTVKYVLPDTPLERDLYLWEKFITVVCILAYLVSIIWIVLQLGYWWWLGTQEVLKWMF